MQQSGNDVRTKNAAQLHVFKPWALLARHPQIINLHVCKFHSVPSERKNTFSHKFPSHFELLCAWPVRPRGRSYIAKQTLYTTLAILRLECAKFFMATDVD